ncbi:MAG TPA: TonB-dependent receptor [Pyrinomonadaceae bacterium]|jgi:outer membrane receptor protein involved in Fe transport|nr:TonB-dependent receptor [Pyrinomonadaceae bacterium]
MRQARAIILSVVALAVAFNLALTYPLATAHAQEQQSGRGALSGTLTDASGANVAGAQIYLINPQQAVLNATKSDTEGRFKFADMPAGTYELRVTHRGFDNRRLSVKLASRETTDVAVTLEVNRIEERITVTAESGQAADRDRVAQQVNVIPESNILQRTTAVLAQVADEEVGVNLQRTSPTIGGIFVRGLTGKNVAVYVDGVRYTTSAQRGGISTFFNLNEPSSLRAVEILRGPNSAQYGSDSLGGTVNLVSRVPGFGGEEPETHGELNTFFTSADLSFGGNTLVTYGTRRFGLLANVNARRVNNLRPAGGIDSHSSITRFLGLPSDILGSRLTDTAFTQYGGTFHANYAPANDQQFIFHYQRAQQDGGKRYDQTLGGDGNLISDLRNLMLDFGYVRYLKQGVGFFDNGSVTASYNTQREERVNQGGRGNPRGNITHQPERTKVFGLSASLDKQFTRHNTFLVGADFYRETVDAPAFTVNPVAGTTVLSRPRIPDGARYITTGIYAQDVLEAIPERLRLSMAVRYHVASYRSRAENAAIVNGRPLFPDDSLREDSFSGRFGAVATVARGLNLSFNYSRGFRAPNITDLGTLGLVGNGFEVDALSAIALGGQIGTNAGADAISSGRPVAVLRSEHSNNFDGGLHFRRKRFDTDLTLFLTDLNNSISQQTLILPPGATGQFLGDQQITRQLPTGAVIVGLSTNPVLVRANFEDARLYGLEYTLDARLHRDLTFGGNFTMIRAYSKATGLPPNIEGGTPPATAFLRLRYEPAGKRYFVEAYSTLADEQTRLSSLDLADRRTGAARSRNDIRDFFNNGARARGLVQLDSFGVLRLVETNETLRQVQDRLLPPGTVQNGILVAGDGTVVPLFTRLPGYGLFNLRGGFRVGERSNIFLDFENIGDKSYRAPSWGIDGAGRSLTARYQYRF